MLKKIVIGLLMIVYASACVDNKVYSEFRNLNNGNWQATDTLKYELSELEIDEAYAVFLNVRNDEDYPFSNLFVITELQYPKGKTEIDTLEYDLARPDGSWLGKGAGSIKESKLWYRENIKIQDSGVYIIKITHAMRKNGEVEGLETLKGITDVGVEVQKL